MRDESARNHTIVGALDHAIGCATRNASQETLSIRRDCVMLVEMFVFKFMNPAAPLLLLAKQGADQHKGKNRVFLIKSISRRRMEFHVP